MKTTFTRLQSESLASTSAPDRTVTAVLSDERVALDDHVIVTAGIDTTDYMKNPVVLFAHDQNSPPIARMLSTWKRGTQLVGKMQFADENTYPFADTIYKLIRSGFLNSMSISWFPTESKPARDRARPGGIDFLRCKLLEMSVVPVPANPGCEIETRSPDIDFAPARAWARAAAQSKNEVTRREAETFIRALTRRADPFAYNELFEEAKTESARLLAKLLIAECGGRLGPSQEDIIIAARESLVEFKSRAKSRGLSSNQIAQLAAIFRERFRGRFDAS